MAQKQVVFIHEKKKDSLKRKLDRLTDVKFFILADDQTEIYDFLKEHNADFSKLPKYKVDDLEGIINEIQSIIDEALPKINGLVLAILVYVFNIITGGPNTLSLVVSMALFFVVLIASFLGTITPITLNKLGFNPALASGPFITTINDLLGLAIYFYIVHLLL